LAAAGFSVITVDLGNGTTDVTDGCLHIGAGDTTNVDSRPDYIVSGTTGVFLFNGQLRNFRNLVYTSACTIQDADIEFADLTQGTAEIEDTILRPVSATTVAACNDPTFGTTTDIHDCQVIQGGAGHMFELSTVDATVTLTNISFSGFGADTTNDAAFYVSAATGTTTINWSGGTAPTYRTAGATVNVVNSVTVSVTTKDAADSSNIQNARVYIEADTGGPLPAKETVTSINRSGSVATVVHTAHGLATGDTVKIRDATLDEYNVKETVTVTGVNGYTYAVAGSPVSPAVGTITASAVIMDQLTTAGGLAEDTGFPFVSDQPFVGRARRSTTSPFYKTVPISGTITTAGATSTVFMVSDEG